MTVKDLLGETEGVNRDEAELLLASVMKKEKLFILSHPEAQVSRKTASTFRRLAARRRNLEPFAYIVGRRWFYGRPFFVTKDTLIPRPETETLIEAALSGCPDARTIIDVGTGSGAVGVTLAAELPEARVIALDVSAKALVQARKNARALGVLKRVSFRRVDVLRKGAPIRAAGPIVVAANLPYLTPAGWKATSRGIRDFEPRNALISGRDGLTHYRALTRRLREWKIEPDLLLLEADPPQMKALSAIVRRALPTHRIEIKDDLAGLARVLVARKAKDPA